VWKDNALVLMMSTIHKVVEPSKHTVKRIRKQPTITSTSAKTAQAPFSLDVCKKMTIPNIVDDYNHKMNGVD
jgi:hypothetical protein